MVYQVFNPHPALSEVVEHYWFSKVTLSGARSQFYPTPLLQGLTFNFEKQEEYHLFQSKTVKLHKPIYFFGQPTCPRTIMRKDREMHMIGVKFTTLGISKLTGINMEHFIDAVIAAEEIWGVKVNHLYDEMYSKGLPFGAIKVLDGFLVEKYLRTPKHHRLKIAEKAIALITQSKGNIHIKDLQDQTFTTRKTLERTFLHHLGLTPKFYTRLVRFNAVKEIIDHTPTQKLTDLALLHGFYDSSHFGNEFKHFTDITATEYIKKRFDDQHKISFCPFFPRRHLVSK